MRQIVEQNYRNIVETLFEILEEINDGLPLREFTKITDIENFLVFYIRTYKNKFFRVVIEPTQFSIKYKDNFNNIEKTYKYINELYSKEDIMNILKYIEGNKNGVIQY